MTTRITDHQKDLSPGFILLHAGSRWSRDIRKVLEPFEITHGQYLLLSVILKTEKEKEAVTQAMVSALSGYEEVTTSTVLAALLKKKMVVKKKHPSDERAYALFLTPAGKKVVVAAMKKVVQFEKEFFNRVKGKKIFLEALKSIIAG